MSTNEEVDAYEKAQAENRLASLQTAIQHTKEILTDLREQRDKIADRRKRYTFELNKVGAIFKTIKARHFVIEQGLVVYFDRPNGSIKGRFMVKSVNYVSKLDSNNWCNIFMKGGAHGGVYRVQFVDSTQYNLFCEIMKAWDISIEGEQVLG